MKIENLQQYYWLANIPDIEFCDQSATVNVEIWHGNEMIYNQILHTITGSTTLYDVKQIVRPYLNQFGVFNFHFYTDEHLNGAEFALTIFDSEIEMRETPAEFFPNNFLTRNGIKQTTLDSTEQLWLVRFNEPNDIYLQVTFYYSDNTSEQQTLHVFEVGDENIEYLCVDTSPRKVFADCGINADDVVAYTVDRNLSDLSLKSEITYVLNQNLPKKTATFFYKNAFGVGEYIDIFGVDETESKIEKQTAWKNHLEFVYNNKLTVKHKITTSLMHASKRDEMHDLFCSDSVCVLDGELFSEIIIDDVTHTVSDAYEATDSYKFSWRKKTENQRNSPTFARIFTNNFNNIFS